MAWKAEAALPFPVANVAHFSPINANEVYVISRQLDFYRYHMGTKVYTALAAPPFTAPNAYRQLTFRNNMYYCLSEDPPAGGGARRITWYNPATNTWASSSQIPLDGAQNYLLQSFCFADNDTIWAWARQGGGAPFRLKCVRYVISTNTWTYFLNDTGPLAVGQARCAAINAAGTIVYTGTVGPVAGHYATYTIAGDAYAISPQHIIAGVPINYVWAADPLRLWFTRTDGLPATWQYGFLTIATLAYTDNHFIAFAGRVGGWFGRIGLLDTLAVIDNARNTAPEIWSEGTIAPTVQTDPATGVT